MLELQRIAVESAEDKIVAAAATELGYTRLVRTTTSVKLKEALHAAGIRPFNIHDVESYKTRMAKSANRTATRLTIAIPAIVAVLLFLLSIIIGTTFLIVAAVAPIFIWGLTVAIAHENRKTWEKHSLEYYNSPVPKFVLQTALDVHRELKHRGIKHSLLVEELTDEKTSIDPFLVLEVEDKWFYLEVWDEPDFGKKRTV